MRLWIGIPSRSSGVFSAGNGPAMRAGVLSAVIGDVSRLKEFVSASTRVTHSDPKAEFGAFAVALAAQMASFSQPIDGRDYLARLVSLLPPEAKELTDLVGAAVHSAESRQTTAAFAIELGLGRGVTGYMYHTVPIAIQAWLAHQSNFKDALVSVIECGGDTDTVASIVGAIAGAACGKQGIPESWLNTMIEWPRSVTWIERLGLRLGRSIESGQAGDELALFVPAIVIRTVLFLIVVLFHGFRRLLPPYR